MKFWRMFRTDCLTHPSKTQVLGATADTGQWDLRFSGWMQWFFASRESVHRRVCPHTCAMDMDTLRRYSTSTLK